MADRNSYDHSDSSQTSLKEVFVKHFFYALDDLRSTWKGKPLDKQEFNLDILYLTSLIPNEDRQNAVLKKWAAAQEDNYQLKGNTKLSKDEVVAYSGMAAVTEIIMFLCESFELATEDITGPATSGEYVSAKGTIEIPDMPEDAMPNPESN